MNKKVIASWVFLILVLFSTLMFIGYKTNKDNKDYYALEADIIEYTNTYLNIKDINLVNGDKIKIDISKLKREKIVDEIKVKDDKCDGYIIVKMSMNNLDIKPFIKCKNYESLDYSKNK